MPTPSDFRKLALSLPSTEERSHMNHPDFRVLDAKAKGGKGKSRIFATLDAPAPGWGMVKLTPEEQAIYLEEHPDIFIPAAGAWGKSGCTHVKLGRGGASAKVLREAMTAAWRGASTSPPRKRRSTPR